MKATYLQALARRAPKMVLQTPRKLELAYPLSDRAFRLIIILGYRCRGPTHPLDPA